MASKSSSTTPGSASGKPEGAQGQPITPGTVPPETVPPDNVPLDAVPPDPITAEINSELARLLSSQSSGSVQQSLDSLKSASEIRKSNADRLKSELEAKKIAIDAHLATKHAYGSFLNAMLSPLVPLASLLTVAVSLYIGNQTVRSAQQQAQTKADEDKIEREEIRWKEFAESLEKASDADKLYKGGTYVTRLRAYSKPGVFTPG